MTARPSEADRLRSHREEMQLALAENLSLAEARVRLNRRKREQFELAIENFHERERAMRAAADRNERCGTADAHQPGQASRPVPHQWWMDL